jgi:hypothetical protein
LVEQAAGDRGCALMTTAAEYVAASSTVNEALYVDAQPAGQNFWNLSYRKKQKQKPLPLPLPSSP